MSKININFLYFSVLIFITILFRLYNINYDDFWIDEIISFYISDPSITLNEFYYRHKTLENSPFLFNFILRNYFEIFGYDPLIARYLPAILNSLSIFFLVYFYKKILRGKSSLIFFILLAFNIYLIKYSQELRLYSWYLFIFVINIYYFYKINDFKNIKSNSKFFLFFLTSILLIITHPFALIIIFSYSVFLIYKYFSKKVFEKKLFKLLMIINCFSIIFLIFFILNTTHQPIWIENIDWKFFTNFFFSKFFGSRLIGGIYLLVFVYLIIKFKNKIFFKSNFEMFLLITIFFSYLIPIIYSYFFNPAVVDRYLIYLVLIIVLSIITLIDKIESKKLRLFLSSLLIISTIGNFFTETTFKQFFKERTLHKPDLKSVLEEINKSTNFNVTLNLEITYLSKSEISNAFENYLKNYSKIDDLEIQFFNYLVKDQKNSSRKFWIICLNDLNGGNCEIPVKFTNFKTIKESSFNSVNIKLVEKVI
mgnify:CR=1 FL=1|tara:strand:- start:44 stop:1480 length:1437 start_codon:yes stop_codon:yes gene_type:complete